MSNTGEGGGFDPDALAASAAETLREHGMDAEEADALGRRLVEVGLRSVSSLGLDSTSGVEHDRDTAAWIFDVEPGGGEESHSIKPENLVVDLGAMMDFAVSGTLTGAGTTGEPVLMVIAGFAIARELWKQMRVGLSPTEAAIVWTLWEHGGKVHPKLSIQDLRRLVDRETRKYGKPKPTDQEFGRALDRLQEIGTVVRLASPGEEESVVLEEKIGYREQSE